MNVPLQTSKACKSQKPCVFNQFLSKNILTEIGHYFPLLVLRVAHMAFTFFFAVNLFPVVLLNYFKSS